MDEHVGGSTHTATRELRTDPETRCESAGCPKDGAAYLGVCWDRQHVVVLPKLTARELRSFAQTGSASIEVPAGAADPRIVFLCDSHAGRGKFLLRNAAYARNCDSGR